MSEYQISFVNYLQDNVHGLIGLTDVENSIEQSAIFKRLQEISQLGLTQRVFPGATHNRYVHSLGVMHLADRIAFQLGFSDYQRQIARLAGLLHDIGHYPFSHDVESVFMREFPRNGSTPYLNGSQGRPFHHERIGSQLVAYSSQIQKILKEQFVERYVDKSEEVVYELNKVTKLIGGVIAGNYLIRIPESGTRINDGIYKLMVQMIHSELDADNLDYVTRDSAYAGTTFGMLNTQRIIKEFSSRDISITDAGLDVYGGKWSILGVMPKGISSVDQYFLNKFFYYNVVIHHKYVSIQGNMLREITYLAYRNHETLRSCITSECEATEALKIFEKVKDVYTKINTFKPEEGRDHLDDYFVNDLIEYAVDSRFLSALIILSKQEGNYKSTEEKKIYKCISEKLISHISPPICEDESTKYCCKNVTLKENGDYDTEIPGHYPTLEPGIEWIITEKRSLTEQVPLNVLKSLPKGDEFYQENPSDKAKQLYRLVNGVPIIKEGKEKQNSSLSFDLIVDDSSSIMSSIYNIAYVKKRKYSLN